jgi:hypothetical protein
MIKIPKDIILTWKDNSIPFHVIDKWRQLNIDYNIKFFTDIDIHNFLDKEYGAEYTLFFKNIPFGRYKADFFRLCYLYKYGGFYVDIDIEPVRSIDSIIDNYTSITFLSVLSLMPGHIFQAVLFSTPNNSIIKMCLDSMLYYGSNIGIDPKNEYPFIGHPTKCTYDNIQLFSNSLPIEGYINKDDQHIVLGIEKQVSNRVQIQFNNMIFGYSRYNEYDREKGFI